jgi:L-lactate dehydrogenase complex protein LldG
MATRENSREVILADVRAGLGRAPGAPVAARPAIPPPRALGAPDQEIERLLSEIAALKGNAQRLASADVSTALADLVRAENVRKATQWSTAGLERLGVTSCLRGLGVEIVPSDAGIKVFGDVDLGITEADFALAETGTLGLLSSPAKPRQVSLVPRIHLAIVPARAFRADMHQVFEEAKKQGYLVFITGPSRTADIELTVTIGVHGPKVLYVWVVDGSWAE